MKRLPVFATILVGLAVATMIGLGVWQLIRKGEKKALLARYAAAANMPEIAWPAMVTRDDAPLFRKASGFCTRVLGWRALSGRNRTGESGFAHVAACGSGAEGPGMQVAIGWSKAPAQPKWGGGEVSGVIAPDKDHIIKLVADRAPAGLEPLAPPSAEMIANNHLIYALQWFFFAGAAAVIFVLAVRRRGVGPKAEESNPPPPLPSPPSPTSPTPPPSP